MTDPVLDGSFAPSSPPMVEIVIVNWNAGDWLHRCLASLRHHSDGIARVTVVDNGSTDGSQDVEFPELPLRVIHAGENLGFGRACNLGARDAKAPYVLFLNPDAALLDDSLIRMVSFLESAPGAGVGICGPRLVGEDGATQRSCFNFVNGGTFVGVALGLSERVPWLFRSQLAHIDYGRSQIVDQPIGAFFLMRRSLFETLGGFDERFFVYYEEVDLAWRAKRAGWDAYYLADAVAFHKGGGATDQVKAERLFYGLRSRLLYASKNFSRAGLGLTLFATLLIEPIARLTRALLRRSGSDFRHTLKAYRLLAADAGAIARVAGADGERVAP